MDRRKALKNLGTTIGTISITPSIIGLFQSCQNNTSQKLVTFTTDQFDFISKLMDLIIPKTETPGAIDLKLNNFIDLFINDVWYEKTKLNFIKGLIKCKDNIEIINDDSLKNLLDKYLRIDKNISEKYDDLISDFEDDLKNDKNLVLDQNIVEYLFVNKLRDMTVMSFKINEYIAKNEMEYLPVPGDYKGCVDLENATGGKVWAL